MRSFAFFCITKNLKGKYILLGYLQNTVGCFVGHLKPTVLIFLIYWLRQKQYTEAHD